MTKLSHQELLTILNQLPVEDGKYVLSFILHYEKQTQVRVRELDIATQRYKVMEQRLKDWQEEWATKNKKKLENYRQNMEDENRSREKKNILREETLKRLITHRQGIAESVKQLESLFKSIQYNPHSLKDEARWEYVRALSRKIGQWLDDYHTTEKELEDYQLSI